MKKWRTVFVMVTLTIVVLGWIFVVPGELKTLMRFSRWHDTHVHASAYVDRNSPNRISCKKHLFFERQTGDGLAV